MGWVALETNRAVNACSKVMRCFIHLFHGGSRLTPRTLVTGRSAAVIKVGINY